MEPVSSYVETDGVVELAKEQCNIVGESKHLVDEQIAEVCRFIALTFAPDTEYIDGKIKFGEIGISIMLSVSLYVFPWHYQKYELWQRN